jgi:ubiquinone/menaquinone biosynthesis C-methylase UbiE
MDSPSVPELDAHLAHVAEAFSRKASVYDAFGLDHPNLTRMRHHVRKHMLALLPQGANILELNAGTGGDALFFAERGYDVHAIDIAPDMVARIRDKALSSNLQDRLTCQECSFTDLNRVEGGPFAAVLSNLGGLNCIADTSQVARRLGPLLEPGALVTLVVMPPVCPWEMASLLRGNLRHALRRLSPGGVLANVEGVRFQTYYFTPGQVQRAFGRAYRRIRLEGLSVFTPTADNKAFAARHPRLYQLLARLDDRLSPLPPFNHWGDFFILSLRYSPEGQ